MRNHLLFVDSLVPLIWCTHPQTLTNQIGRNTWARLVCANLEPIQQDLAANLLANWGIPNHSACPFLCKIG